MLDGLLNSDGENVYEKKHTIKGTLAKEENQIRKRIRERERESEKGRKKKSVRLGKCNASKPFTSVLLSFFHFCSEKVFNDFYGTDVSFEREKKNEERTKKKGNGNAKLYVDV